MAQPIMFKPYIKQYQGACLTIFDENCPAYFAPNERQDYQDFLTNCPDNYEVCFISEELAGAYGLCGNDKNAKSINWIMISSRHQGAGVGKAMMTRAIQAARKQQIQTINIAASHLSAPFFSRFNAIRVKETPDGWGKGMHRIDMVLKP